MKVYVCKDEKWPDYDISTSKENIRWTSFEIDMTEEELADFKSSKEHMAKWDSVIYERSIKK